MEIDTKYHIEIQIIHPWLRPGNTTKNAVVAGSEMLTRLTSVAFSLSFWKIFSRGRHQRYNTQQQHNAIINYAINNRELFFEGN